MLIAVGFSCAHALLGWSTAAFQPRLWLCKPVCQAARHMRCWSVIGFFSRRDDGSVARDFFQLN